MPKSKKQGKGNKVGRNSKKPCHGRYNNEFRWIKNKKWRIARHNRQMALRHARAVARGSVLATGTDTAIAA